MGRIFVTSDLHFNHDRSFIYAPRGFDCITKMNLAIVENWNATVAPEDEVYVLGDLMLGDNEIGIEYLRRLNGTIHVVRGNHDTDTRIQLYSELPNIIEVVAAKYLRYNGYHFYMSHYPCLTSNYDDKNEPLKSKLISLCGHSHYQNKFKDMDKGLIYHCELDCNFIQPVLINKIIENLEWFSALSAEKKKQIISMEVYNEKDRYDWLENE